MLVLLVVVGLSPNKNVVIDLIKQKHVEMRYTEMD